MLQESHDFWEVHVPSCLNHVEKCFLFMHVLLYCDNRRGNSHLHICIGDLFAQLMHASLPTTKTPEPTTRLLKPVYPSLEIPIYNQHLLDAGSCIALKWLMQCYASLTAKVCLESENLLRSYHSNPPPSLLSQRHRDRHTTDPKEYTSIFKNTRLLLQNMSPHLLITGYSVSRNLVQLANWLVTYCSNVFAVSWAALDLLCFVKVFCSGVGVVVVVVKCSLECEGVERRWAKTAMSRGVGCNSGSFCLHSDSCTAK